MKIFNKRAFTLLELLVVLGIIAILVGLGTASFSTSQKKARDAKRKGDLNSIQTSLEQYYSTCGFQYPLPNGAAVPTIVCASPSVAIMTNVPTDPKSGVSYIMTGTTSTYTICAPTIAAGMPLESEAGATAYCLDNKQ